MDSSKPGQRPQHPLSDIAHDASPWSRAPSDWWPNTCAFGDCAIHKQSPRSPGVGSIALSRLLRLSRWVAISPSSIEPSCGGPRPTWISGSIIWPAKFAPVRAMRAAAAVCWRSSCKASSISFRPRCSTIAHCRRPCASSWRVPPFPWCRRSAPPACRPSRSRRYRARNISLVGGRRGVVLCTAGAGRRPSRSVAKVEKARHERPEPSQPIERPRAVGPAQPVDHRRGGVGVLSCVVGAGIDGRLFGHLVGDVCRPVFLDRPFILDGHDWIHSSSCLSARAVCGDSSAAGRFTNHHPDRHLDAHL